MSAKAPRRLWQLHLSTVITLTLAAGGLLGLNVFHHKPLPSLCLDHLSEFGIAESDLADYEELASRGLPFVSVLERDVDKRDYCGGRAPIFIWCYRGLAGNLLIAAVVLVSTAIGMEYVIRRRGGNT